jgi:hypothetical protein
MSSVNPSLPPYFIFIVIILLVLLRIIRRTYANYKGTRFSLPRTIIFGCIYVLIGIFFSALSFVDGVSYLLVAAEIIVASAAAYWSYKYSDKRISFWKTSDGSLYFRGGIIIYLIYIAGLVARLSIDVAFIGPGMFAFASGMKLGGPALYGSMTTDMILIFGVGLLIGRSVRVEKRYLRIQHGEEKVKNIPEIPASEFQA